MFDKNVKCRGSWEVQVDDDQVHEFLCDQRNTCFRYVSRYSMSLPSFFDRVPKSVDMGECRYYIWWQ